MDIKQIVLDLCALSDEQEWFEFKENWFQPEVLGEYVSALSNAAAFHYKKNAFFIWGVNDVTHEIVGTTFNQYCDYNKEPYQNYLARNLSPSINFKLELDADEIVNMMMKQNEAKYPVDKAKGNAAKYTEL